MIPSWQKNKVTNLTTIRAIRALYEDLEKNAIVIYGFLNFMTYHYPKTWKMQMSVELNMNILLQPLTGNPKF